MTGSGSPSRVQDAQRRKAAPLGTHRDSELGFSTKGLILLATPGGWAFCSSSRFGACASSLEQDSGCFSTFMSNLFCGPPISTHWGLPSNRQVCSRTKTRSGAAPLRGPTRTEMRCLQVHTEPCCQCDTPPTTIQSQPADLKQPQQEIGNQKGGGYQMEPWHPSPMPPLHTRSFTPMQAHSGTQMCLLSRMHAHVHMLTQTHAVQTD